MAMDNSNDEDKLHASTSLPQRSEEQGRNLLTNNSANIDNVPQISQSHNREVAPSEGNLMTNSSQINNPSNFHMGHYLHEGDNQSLFRRPNSGFLNQHAPFNLNSSERLQSGRKAAIDNNGYGGRPQVPNLPLDFDFGMPMFGPNQGAVSLNSPENLGERHLTSNSGSNTNAEIDTKLFGINLAGESRRRFVPPFSSHHSTMDNRRFPYPNFGMDGVISGSQNNNEVIYHLPQNADAWMHSTDNHNLRPSVRFRPPSLPSGSNQITQCDIKQSRASEHTVFSSPGMASNQPLSGQLPEFQVNSNGAFSFQSPPLGVATGRTSGMDHSNLEMQRLMLAQGSRPCLRASLKRGASESHSSLAQARQRKTPMNRQLIPPSVPTWTGSAPLMPNTTQTVFRSSHNAMPFTPQATSSTVHPPLSTWARTALSAPNTSQTIPPSIHSAPFLPAQTFAATPPPYYDKRMPYFHPGSQIISPPHQPRMTQSLPQRIISPPNRSQMTQSLPQPVTSPAHRSQMTQSLPHPVTSPAHQPQMTQSPPQPHSRPPPILPSTRKFVPSIYIKRKDESPKLIGHKCCLCKRDLSFAPEGPISQPSPAPDTAVLPCGHTFHDECLGKITPKDQAKEPPCIPCALGE